METPATFFEVYSGQYGLSALKEADAWTGRKTDTRNRRGF
jgi:hypothetical protein